jgi:hypothetical protein
LFRHHSSHASQVQTLFDHHGKAPWFQERYDLSQQFVNLRKRVRKEGWEGKLEKFLHELEEGVHDPNLADYEPISPTTAPVPPSDPQNGDLTDAPATDEAKPDEDMPVDAEEEVADNESVKNEPNGKSIEDAKRLRSDEVSVMPEGNQVMIRTIPPDIGRVKLEEVSLRAPVGSEISQRLFMKACASMDGFIYLALGEPMQKRNYYRAGWIRYRDDTDMEKAVSELGDKKVNAAANEKARVFDKSI